GRAADRARPLGGGPRPAGRPQRGREGRPRRARRPRRAVRPRDRRRDRAARRRRLRRALVAGPAGPSDQRRLRGARAARCSGLRPGRGGAGARRQAGVGAQAREPRAPLAVGRTVLARARRAARARGACRAAGGDPAPTLRRRRQAGGRLRGAHGALGGARGGAPPHGDPRRGGPGPFVEGLGAYQAALPDAIDDLRPGPPPTTLALVSACDPICPYGGIAPDTEGRIARVPSNYLVLRAGAPLLLVEGFGRRVTPLAEASDDVLAAGLAKLRGLLAVPAHLR